VAYQPRIEVPGGYYHVVTRGNNKRSIFADRSDRRMFMLILHRVARRFGWSVLVYCLMGNHYHLIVQLGENGISRGMCELNSGYAIDYNKRHGRSNHLFGRRFWSELLKTDAHLLQTCRYVVLNPVRAGLVKAPQDWVYSSYRATIGMAAANLFPEVRRVLDLIAPGAADPVAAFREYCEGAPPPLEDPPPPADDRKPP
jgi:REP element-mobilizing transposase RayT